MLCVGLEHHGTEKSLKKMRFLPKSGQLASASEPTRICEYHPELATASASARNCELQQNLLHVSVIFNFLNLQLFYFVPY
jgi:hypothetical protein